MKGLRVKGGREGRQATSKWLNLNNPKLSRRTQPEVGASGAVWGKDEA